MLYSNGSSGAEWAMERMRTGNYGDDYENEEIAVCPVCGAEAEYFYIYNGDECIGCSECLTEITAIDFRKMLLARCEI